VTSTDSATVTTVVAVDPATAFEVFTEEVDAWWKHGPRYRAGGDRKSTMRFEPGVGGRLLEVYDEEVLESYELGRVRVWKPGERLTFQMRGRDLGPGEGTEVEIRFEKVDAGTRVTVVHGGWDAFADDHPVRHGLVGEAFQSMMGLWWADLLVAMRRHARRPSGDRT
jgi:hypothetical protein